MLNNTTSGLQVIKKDEKEPRVKAFVENFLSRLEEGGAEADEFVLLARSPESPVCRALTALLPRLKHTGIELRVVYTAIDTGAFHSEPMTGPLIDYATVRIINDARLYEAHEQLVLDASTCWIGDCMRREAAKRDAYENYVANDAETARSAATTFGYLWQAGLPTAPLMPVAPTTGFKDAAQSGLLGNAPGAEAGNAPTVLTRH